MEITYLGHSCFKIKGKTASVVTDPYDSSLVGRALPKVEANIVTVSHQHPDHNNASAVSGGPKVISGPGEYEVSGVSIFGIRMFHDEKGGEKRGENIVYNMTIDKIKVCHLGDLGHKLSDDQMSEVGSVDILLVPVGGVYTIDAQEAAEVVTSLDPKIVIPMHYTSKEAGFGVSGLSDVDEFVGAVGMEPAKIEKYQITYDKLPEERQLVILEIK